MQRRGNFPVFGAAPQVVLNGKTTRRRMVLLKVFFSASPDHGHRTRKRLCDELQDEDVRSGGALLHWLLVDGPTE